MMRPTPKRLRGAAVPAAGALLGALLLLPGPASATPTGIAVTSLSITRGSTAGGTNLIINGYGFGTVSESTATNVTFGGVNATAFLVLSGTQIAAKAPAGTGTVDVRVTDGTSTSAIVNGDKFTYRTPITTTVPAGTMLNSLGGSVVTLTSSYNWGTAAAFAAERITATVGGTAVPVTYVDSTHVTVTAPVGTPSATPAAVMLLHDTVAGVADTTNAQYAAVIGSISRTSGPLAGGAVVTLTGKGFTGATSWLFGAAAAVCTNAAAPNADVRATCTVPPSASGGTTPGAVTVRFTPAAGAGYGITAGSAYTYTDLS